VLGVDDSDIDGSVECNADGIGEGAVLEMFEGIEGALDFKNTGSLFGLETNSSLGLRLVSGTGDGRLDINSWL